MSPNARPSGSASTASTSIRRIRRRTLHQEPYDRAGPRPKDGVPQRAFGRERLVVDCEQQLSGVEPGPLGRRAGRDAGNHQRRGAGHRVVFDAQPRRGGRWAACVIHPGGGVHGGHRDQQAADDQRSLAARGREHHAVSSLHRRAASRPRPQALYSRSSRRRLNAPRIGWTRDTKSSNDIRTASVCVPAWKTISGCEAITSSTYTRWA
jgi:hypothetical protein